MLAFFFVLLTFSALAEENDCIYYFYGQEGCEDCTAVNNYVAQLQARYPELQIQHLEVYFHPENLVSLQGYYDGYGIPEAAQQLPIVILPGSYFIGKQAITTLLEQRLIDNLDTACPSPKDEVIGVTGEGSPKNVLQTMTFARLTGAAISNSFAFAVILLYMALFLFSAGIKEAKDWKWKGFLFLVAVFVIYFFFGLGLFSWFLVLPAAIMKFMGFIGILLGGIIIENFLMKAKPDPQPSWWEKVKLSLTSPVAVVAITGILSLCTLSSASKVLLSLRTLIQMGTGKIVLVTMLAYYLLLFMLPFAVIIFLLYSLRTRGTDLANRKEPGSRQRADIWAKHYLKLINVALAIIIILLGIIGLSR